MKKIILCMIIFSAVNFLATRNTQAQVAGIPFTASLDTFSAISGITLDGPFVDDAIYPNLNIGFNFSFGGTTHTKFTASTNGFIELDTTSLAYLYVQPLNGNRNNIIAPLGADLMHTNANASLQYTTIGTSPNQITVIQWLHYSYFAGSGDISFQIWLFESSNCIRFVYGANSLVSAPLQTQIGLRGTTNADFIALGDTSCNWACAYPYSAINTAFPVSQSCSMPSGFAFHFGACANNGGLNFSYLTGKIFNDSNGNGTLDAGENGIPNRIVNINPGNYYLSSNGIGNFAFFFFDSTLTYTLTSSAPPLYWNQTSPAALSVAPLTQSCSGNNFGLQMMPNVHEVSITTPNWGAKPGQPEPMPISFHNNGTVTESDTISFVMDSLYSFISSTPAPAYVSGQTIKWAYSNLLVGNYGYIYLSLLPDSSAVLGNYLNSTLTIEPSVNDTVPGNNVVNLHQLITNAWDPNEKSVEPVGMIASGTELNYTIHFQNTGNAPAENIVVKDALDAGLDPMTFILTGSSHPLNFTMSGSGDAAFTFYNIQLPDSGTNFAASNGWLSYAIKTRDALAPLTVINNTAEIYFDYNPAVITNTVADTIQMITAVDGAGIKQFVIKASPNPSSGNVVFVFSTNAKEKANLKINSADGRVVLSKENISSIESVDIRALPAGIYICSLKTSTGIHSIKLVKE